MKKTSIRLLSLFSVFLLAIISGACGTPTLPVSMTAAPTRTPTVDFTTILVSPETGGEAASKEPAEETGLLPQTAGEPQPPQAEPSPTCAEPAGCARLVITQGGQVMQAEWANGEFATIAQPSLLPREQSDNNRWTIDTGVASPDGKRVAFTSLGYERGGPIFLQQLDTGAWTNVIETINLLQPEGRDPLPEDLMWDVIGWFPDSQHLMIGPYDLSFVAVVDLSTFTARIIPFPGGGRGGRAYVDLADDGSHFIYIGVNSAGAQTISAYNLAGGNTTLLRELPYDQGILSSPRLSPDGKNLVYVRQHPDVSAGFSGELDLFSLETGAVTPLVKGSLWMATPAWSPDGSRLAFTLGEQSSPLLAAKDGDPGAIRGNIWTVSIADGAMTQITQIDGLARSPVWSPDGKSLAFVTHEGRVGLASADQPGLVRIAGGPAALQPELTSVYFLP